MIPIFVLGSPRSGTTMLGAMLGSTEQSIAIPESPYIGQICYQFLLNSGKYSRDETLLAIHDNHRFRHWKMDVDWDEFAGQPLMSTGEFRQMIQTLLARFADKHIKQAKFWIEHSSTNAKYVLALNNVFPDAHFIHIIRDGRAVAASVLPLDWGATDVQEAARLWLGDLGFSFAAERHLKGQQFYTVTYEELVRHPDETLQDLCEKTGMNYNPDMVYGGDFDVPAYNDKQHLLVGQRPDPSRLDAWKEKLKHREIEIFELVAGPMLQDLGYPLVSKKRGKTLSFLERIRFVVRGVYQREFLNRIRSRRRRNL